MYQAGLVDQAHAQKNHEECCDTICGYDGCTYDIFPAVDFWFEARHF